MNRIMIIVTMLAGWVAAALLWLRAPQPPGECVEITQTHSAPAPAPKQRTWQPSPVVPEAVTMQVYVRPHPPDFVTGRQIRFQSYSVFHDGGVEKIRFVDGDSVTVVDSEAVDWPQQTQAPTYR